MISSVEFIFIQSDPFNPQITLTSTDKNQTIICEHLRTTAMDGGSANLQGAMIGKSADIS
jgi:hypothetical protein